MFSLDSISNALLNASLNDTLNTDVVVPVSHSIDNFLQFNENFKDIIVCFINWVEFYLNPFFCFLKEKSIENFDDNPLFGDIEVSIHANYDGVIPDDINDLIIAALDYQLPAHLQIFDLEANLSPEDFFLDISGMLQGIVNNNILIDQLLDTIGELNNEDTNATPYVTQEDDLNNLFEILNQNEDNSFENDDDDRIDSTSHDNTNEQTGSDYNNYTISENLDNISDEEFEKIENEILNSVPDDLLNLVDEIENRNLLDCFLNNQ